MRITLHLLCRKCPSLLVMHMHAAVTGVQEPDTNPCAQVAFWRLCSVHSVEAVLSALECCGVDNARIEIEGGGELPTLDGSAVVRPIALSQSAAATVGWKTIPHDIDGRSISSRLPELSTGRSES